MGPMDIVILLLLFALLGWSLRTVYLRRRSGGCGCGCEGDGRGCAKCDLFTVKNQ